ncbi:hypothetical protein FMM74_016610 [Lachnospiraceae bacterium MD308]|nr:hypothetical protein [Lachnospiraceae bacterium MD308]
MEGAYKDCPEGDLVRVYEGMDLFDDDLMSMVFDGNIPATEFLLKIILKRDDIIVISAVSQREFKKYLQSGVSDICTVESLNPHKKGGCRVTASNSSRHVL